MLTLKVWSKQELFLNPCLVLVDRFLVRKFMFSSHVSATKTTDGPGREDMINLGDAV